MILLLTKLSEAQKKEQNEGEIRQLTDEFDEAVEERKRISIETGFGDNNRKERGLNNFVKTIKESLAKKDTQACASQAEFLFLQSMRRYAGHFNKQHGSIELTNSRGMQALANAATIRELTCSPFVDDAGKHAKVTQVMDWWFFMAEILYDIGKILKSQAKFTEEKLEQYDCLLAKYGISWRQRITWKRGTAVFFKLHCMECSFRRFAMKYGMTGRASTEGFENTHYHLTALGNMLSRIVKTQHRVEKLSQRQQVSLLPELSKPFEKLGRMSKTGMTRGPYNTKASPRIEEDVEVEPDSEDEDNTDPDGFFSTDNDGLLPESFADIYNLFKKSKTPESWTSSITDGTNHDVGNKARLDFCFTA